MNTEERLELKYRLEGMLASDRELLDEVRQQKELNPDHPDAWMLDVMIARKMDSISALQSALDEWPATAWG